MSNVIIKKNTGNFRRAARLLGFGMSFLGFGIIFFFTFPLLSWKIFNEPAFANQDMEAPIPKVTVLSKDSIKGLLSATANSITGIDYTNASNWYPESSDINEQPLILSYKLSIPKLTITDATVSTVDNNLKEHLVNFKGTAVPPSKGTAVVFGHSTLPQLFNPKDYKTIFARAHTLSKGDTIVVTSDGADYTYRIFNIFITTPDDMSVLSQSFDDSYLTVITCTPPGTIWKRLIVQARLESI